MNTKPRVLVFTNVFLPGYLAGGPVRSIANLIQALSSEFEMLVVTSDRDFGASRPYEDVKFGEWNVRDDAKVYYLTPAERSLAAIRRLIARTPHDMLYLNSFFSFRFSILPICINRFGLAARRPILLAPRGEFSAAARRLKAWKKRPFTRLARLLRIYRDVAWHASTQSEVQEIVRATGADKARIFVARNLASSRVVPASKPRASATPRLRVCFVARISRMKNLDFVLDVMAKLAIPASLAIYGPTEDIGYWRECETAIAALPQHVEARHCGVLSPDRVAEAIAEHDVFFAPSRSENFGHVFLEAWSAGVPVLVSDCTPWRELQTAGVGWDLPLADPLGFVAALNTVAQWSELERENVARRCRLFASSHVHDADATEANRRMFRAALQL